MKNLNRGSRGRGSGSRGRGRNQSDGNSHPNNSGQNRQHREGSAPQSGYSQRPNPAHSGQQRQHQGQMRGQDRTAGEAWRQRTNPASGYGGGHSSQPRQHQARISGQVQGGSVSLVPPVLCADLAAYRGLLYEEFLHVLSAFFHILLYRVSIFLINAFS